MASPRSRSIAPSLGLWIQWFPGTGQARSDTALSGYPVRFDTRKPIRTALGHVWTAPAVQEEADFQRSVRVESCIRPLSAADLTAGLM
jgi:hypothetical protein